MLKKRMMCLWSVAAFFVFTGFSGLTFAGDLEPSASPAPTMHTLEDIYQAVIGGGSGGGDCPDAPVEKTGQTTSFAFGDDGALEKGVPWPNPRFTKNGDGTVTDNLTGLVWMKNANHFGTQNWNSALISCNDLANGTAGLTDGSVTGDWRLPSAKELQSLVHYGVFSPSLPNTAGTGKWSADDPFTNVQLSFYWSATTDASDTGNAWAVNLDKGRVAATIKTGSRHVWCVR